MLGWVGVCVGGREKGNRDPEPRFAVFFRAWRSSRKVPCFSALAQDRHKIGTLTRCAHRPCCAADLQDPEVLLSVLGPLALPRTPGSGATL